MRTTHPHTDTKARAGASPCPSWCRGDHADVLDEIYGPGVHVSAAVQVLTVDQGADVTAERWQGPDGRTLVALLTDTGGHVLTARDAHELARALAELAAE